MKIIDGGVTAAKGFKAAAVALFCFYTSIYLLDFSFYRMI